MEILYTRETKYLFTVFYFILYALYPTLCYKIYVTNKI